MIDFQPTLEWIISSCLVHLLFIASVLVQGLNRTVCVWALSAKIRHNPRTHAWVTEIFPLEHKDDPFFFAQTSPRYFQPMLCFISIQVWAKAEFREALQMDLCKVWCAFCTFKDPHNYEENPTKLKSATVEQQHQILGGCSFPFPLSAFHAGTMSICFQFSVLALFVGQHRLVTQHHNTVQTHTHTHTCTRKTLSIGN